MEKYKKDHKITQYENTLSSVNSKSCNIDKFKEYVLLKNIINSILLEKYKDARSSRAYEYFRKYKWYSYINTERSEANLIKAIKTKYGDKSIMVYGDWNIPKQLRNHISTPMIGLKRKLNKVFKIYNIDEFRTTCLNYKTETRCSNLYLPNKEGITKKLHSVLTYQMENQRYGCINRDINSVKNMRKLTLHWLDKSERLIAYKRGVNLKTIDNNLGDLSPASNVIIPRLCLSKNISIIKDKKLQTIEPKNKTESKKLDRYEKILRKHRIIIIDDS
jgi:hypothetical protein